MIAELHDHRERIRRVFPELVPQDGPVNFSIEVAGWRLIGLDSLDEGDIEGAGDIEEDQRDWLAQQLTDHGEEPTILFVHHPPFSVQTAWLDRVSLRNRTALIKLVRGFPQVRAISAGHVHLEYQAAFGQIELLTTPSTAFQFRRYENGPVCDPIPPGFRRFRLEGSSCVTEVIRLPELRFPPSA